MFCTCTAKRDLACIPASCLHASCLVDHDLHVRTKTSLSISLVYLIDASSLLLSRLFAFHASPLLTPLFTYPIFPAPVMSLCTPTTSPHHYTILLCVRSCIPVHGSASRVVFQHHQPTAQPSSCSYRWVRSYSVNHNVPLCSTGYAVSVPTWPGDIDRTVRV